jgi:ABC-type dipeptide/oligopeptide/nickel transport system permease subunit
VSLLVGVVAVALGVGLGVLSGLVAGFFGGIVDATIMRISDGLMAFPTVLLGIAVVTALGPGVLNVAYAIGLAQAPHFARITRAAVLVERKRDYVLASRSLGASDLRLMVRHVLPNCLSPLLVQLTLTMIFAILAEASLSFLGLGTQPPTPSWGAMLSESRAYLSEAPWMGVWPGLTLAVLLLGLNYLQDALRDALDPRRAGWG